jgi:TIR domain-containing protein
LLLLIFEQFGNLEGQNRSPDTGQETTIFISYAREDFDAAKKLSEDLKRAGLTPWLDKKSLVPGQNWRASINNAIKKSRYFVPLLSSNSVGKRGFVQKEFKHSLDVLDEVPESQIFIIPARLDDCEIPYKKLKDIEYVDLFPDWNKGVQRLIEAAK